RLEGGELSIKKEVVLISSLCKDIATSMAAAMKSNGVTFRTILKDNSTLTLETDKELLKNILDCFLSNALNFSKAGQEILFNCEAEDENLVFSVHDSGIGIPKEEQKRVFERFYRASNAKALKPGGTGLGLYIASVLAEKIGGKISFESEEGKGSTFYVRVPKGRS
ncbi:MAG: HAMP domain-containing sensor histidine kinase, partial [bacterium]|nr:HAMP domain-containing sensor histidine kinase [bacterium]